MRRAHFLVVLSMLSAVVPMTALAETLTYSADLKATSEVPPTSSSGLGSVTASYDTASKQLTWKGSYSSLTGDATAAHFHGPAMVGANGPVAVPVTEFKSPFTGTAGLTDAQAADLEAGKLYFNVHTAKNPNGELRGQVVRDK